MLFDETPLTFAQASRRLPHHPHPSTLWRWYHQGVRGVKLEAVRLGGRLLTSQEALERFAARLAAVDAIPAGADAPSLSRQDRAVAVARAERFCEDAGI